VERVFFDTNVIVYAHDRSAGIKQLRARDLLDRHARTLTIVVSTQVLIESYNALQRAAALSREAALNAVETLTRAHVVPADGDFVVRAIQLAQRWQLSHWDALVVQAALDAGCSVLYTEDLQAGQRFGELEVVNPFDDAMHEPTTAYVAAAKSTARKLKKR
jgi:predicted nucleic acid-binding protein